MRLGGPGPLVLRPVHLSPPPHLQPATGQHGRQVSLREALRGHVGGSGSVVRKPCVRWATRGSANNGEHHPMTRVESLTEHPPHHLPRRPGSHCHRTWNSSTLPLVAWLPWPWPAALVDMMWRSMWFPPQDVAAVARLPRVGMTPGLLRPGRSPDAWWARGDLNPHVLSDTGT
jgi:hypothetical protein